MVLVWPGGIDLLVRFPQSITALANIRSVKPGSIGGSVVFLGETPPKTPKHFFTMLLYIANAPHIVNKYNASSLHPLQVVTFVSRTFSFNQSQPPLYPSAIYKL